MSKDKIYQIIANYVAFVNEELRWEFPDEPEEIRSMQGTDIDEMLVSPWVINQRPEEWYHKHRQILNTIRLEESYGGEGKGDEYWKIFKFTDTSTGENAFLKFEGYYSSWDGVEWNSDSPYLVEPVQVTVTKFKRIEE